jgi:hypothetical protein
VSQSPASPAAIPVLNFEVLATNTLDNQSFIASPVIVDGTIYLRSRTHLFAIGEGGSAE